MLADGISYTGPWKACLSPMNLHPKYILQKNKFEEDFQNGRNWDEAATSLFL